MYHDSCTILCMHVSCAIRYKRSTQWSDAVDQQYTYATSHGTTVAASVQVTQGGALARWACPPPPQLLLGCQLAPAKILIGVIP